jgi:hypothetical protein
MGKEGKKRVRVILDIQDNERANALVELLKQLPFVKIEKGREKRKTNKKLKALDDIFGIWKDRNISKGSLRREPWKRRYQKIGLEVE